MITAKLAQKPFLEIPKSTYDQIAKTGKKTVKISILSKNGDERAKKKSTPNRKNLQAFADKTLGIWADDPKITQAFNELEERWQQWRDETLSSIPPS